MPAAEPGRKKKTIRCRQADIDAVPFGSGDWSVEDVPGLILRAGAHSKTWRIQRRVGKRLARKVLGEMSAAEARRAAMKAWASLKPAPPGGRLTLAEAWQAYLSEKDLAGKTRAIYKENFQRYLEPWGGRTLEAIGEDRAGLRRHFIAIAREHGAAVASQTLRCLLAVYNYQRLANPNLPDLPGGIVSLPAVRPRDWALDDNELRAWWTGVQRLRSPVKRTFWATMLLTGARRDSVRLLRWQDVDFERKTLRFSTAKAGRTYSIPMSGRLARLLERWRGECPPGCEWVFESPKRPGQPLSIQVRNDKQGICSAHHLRHTARTKLAELGATPDLARIALGHSMTGDVSRGYITPGLLIEAARPLFERLAERYAEILGWDDAAAQ